MKLTHEIKRMLSAIAQSNAGENLSLRQKGRLLANNSVPVCKPEVAVVQETRPQVGLYLGSELADDVMQYVIQTCVRLKHGLTVLTFQLEGDVEALLQPYQSALAAADIALRINVLSGEPPAALAQALRRRPEVAFLVCNEGGFLGHGLMKGSQGMNSMPVPVVLVAANASDQASRRERASAVQRAA